MPLFTHFIISYLINFSCASILSELAKCVAPPLDCPNENVTFWLYTRKNMQDPHKLLALDGSTTTSAPWVKDAPIKILIHGYIGHKNFSPNTEIRPAYMECCNYNIISIDYNPIAKHPCYTQAAQNTELVGKCTAQLIDRLVTQHGFDLARFHVIGFSLGGQTAGFVAKYLTSGKLSRITALDPAMPLFVTNDALKKIDKTDAKFVDVLHTDILGKGKMEASGHVDFYANGGRTQPGCPTTTDYVQSGCSHARAPKYYAESISSPVGFQSIRCPMWISYMLGWCTLANSDAYVQFGEHVPHNISGLYFFSTNAEPPFAKKLHEK